MGPDEVTFTPLACENPVFPEKLTAPGELPSVTLTGVEYRLLPESAKRTAVLVLPVAFAITSPPVKCDFPAAEMVSVEPLALT